MKELILEIIFITALLFLFALSSDLKAPHQFQSSSENSGICFNDKDSNIEEDEFSTYESFNKKIFFIPQITLFTTHTDQTSLLNSEIWNPPKSNILKQYL